MIGFITTDKNNNLVGHIGRGAVCLLKGDGNPGVENIVKQEEQPFEKEKSERLVICKMCSNIITSQEYKKLVNDKNIHTFFNPQGIIFEFGCYSKAKGCVVSGKPTAEFSWFKGYSWSFTSCSSCGEHLGWFFQSGTKGSFFGLIMKKLIEQK